MNRYLAVGAIALPAALILGGIDRRSAEVTAQHERAAAEKKADVKPEDRFALSYPLSCDATMSARVHEHEKPIPRCYMRKAVR